MSIRDYDKIAIIIEENIDRGWPDVRKILESEFYTNVREIGDFFKRVSDDNLSLRKYFSQRKAYRTIEHAHSQRINDVNYGTAALEKTAIEDFGYGEYSTFYNHIKALFNGKSPTEVLKEEGLEISEPRNILSIVKGLGMLTEAKEPEVANLKRLCLKLIDEKREMAEEIETLKKNGGQMFLNQATGILKRDDIKPELDAYLFYRQLESLRAIYEFEIEEMLEILIESRKNGEDIEYLCENYFELDCFKTKEELDDDLLADYEERLDEWHESELNVDEYWRLYHEDDEYDNDDSGWY